jgi:hypothetical protein
MIERAQQNFNNRLWDNNSGAHAGGSNPDVTGITTTSTPAQTQAFTAGPNPEPYLQTRETRSAFRKFVPYLKLQPEIAVKQPWAVSSTYIQNTQQSTAQLRGQVPMAAPQGSYRAMSPSQTMQRDLQWDAADSDKTLQRFHFSGTPSQRYFDEKIPLPEFTTPSYYAHSVIAGNNEYYPVESKRGWYQGFDPGIDMRENDVAAAPPWLLSTPLNVHQITYSEYDHRQPVVGKAPKRRKSAGV